MKLKSPIKTIIVDDEAHCVNRLLHLAERRPATFEILGTASSVEDAQALIIKSKPNLIFLDIEIGERTGFDLLKSLKKVDFEVIFTTAHSNYAIKAIKYSAFDYLMKPIDLDDFNTSIDRLMASDNHTSKRQVSGLLNNAKSNRPVLISIPTMQGFDTLQIDHIIRLEASANYTIITTANEQTVVSKPLAYYATIFENDTRFFKSHKSHIINLEQVKSYLKGKHPLILMKNGDAIPLALRRKDEFLSQF